jgi:hypothetical protein
MDESQLLATAVAVAAVAAVSLVAVGLTSAMARQRTSEELRRSRQDVEALRARVEQLAAQVPPEAESPSAREDAGALSQEFLITSLADPVSASLALPSDRLGDQPGQATDRRLTAGQFASTALAESLVTVVSFGHGLRRALRPEHRSRIRFAVRQEVKRARRQRRRDLKAARRLLREQQSGGERTNLQEDAA